MNTSHERNGVALLKYVYNTYFLYMQWLKRIWKEPQKLFSNWSTLSNAEFFFLGCGSEGEDDVYHLRWAHDIQKISI